MKTNINTLRREEQIKNAIAKIISYDITNVNVIDPVVVDAYLSNDLSHVKIYVTFASNKSKALEALNNANGFIRKELSRILDWRKIPEVHFELDEVGPSGAKIDKILNEIKKEK
ncbi:Ribosome-binding factor A [Mycoplasmopsis meleagridis]|uniref:Ribosome-binding factor A n=1 Tax=Mycoplasmopsis meleagridis ATCC 25294 TaxID=1264554 RepID=A0A0F5H0U0_9BACT|nr:30S ribosome-binding factor RbfA [Mycoplasmopsis meleagridis]KKB26941.1 Ribosome-binding factor A [Mycoplasmopsis meleagridis ATCC 25294]KUH47485.1 ribosome-binding factor A [Mycoplasmopsis meleagridis]OAD18530.1 Ribosome-binding factor A [Mycoplasmopsis meleagridis]VEU77601.1 Ribosome-binding factor A [Mycoplasmopsis meleagridis]